MSGMGRRAAAGVIALLAGALASCGGGTTSIRLFTTDWSDDGGRSIQLLQQKLAGQNPPAGADVVVAVAGPDKLIGLPLGGGSRWTFAHALDARPVIAGRVVVGSGAAELFALDASTGRRLWARPTGGLRVHGAGDDGSVTVVTMSNGTGRGSVLLAVARDGSVVRQIETDKRLGTPAVLGGYAFVPWGSLYVSAIDLEGGVEAARVVVRESTSRAWTQGGELYFGEIGIFRFDAHIKDADKNQAAHAALPVRELPGSPKLMVPGNENPGPAAGAPDRIRIFARPSGGESMPLGIDSDRYYATYFKLVMGFDATNGALSWVHTHGSDVIAGAAGAGNVVLCDEEGKVTVLDAKTGGPEGTMDLGEGVLGCVVQVDAYHASKAPEAVPPLAAQLSTAIVNREAQLATAKRLLLRELSSQPDEGATKTLIEVASDERTSPLILPDARRALADRRTGAKFMLDALARHYDYVHDVLAPPPVGPIAQALAAMGDKRGAPLLASHLLDPADTGEDVLRAAEALVTLAGPGEAPLLGQFFSMYRGTAPDEEMEMAVVRSAVTLARVGGPEWQARVRAAMQDPMTLPSLRERLRSLVTLPAPPAADAADAGAAADAGPPKAIKKK